MSGSIGKSLSQLRSPPWSLVRKAEIDFGDEIDFGESEAVQGGAIDFSAVDMP